MDTSLFHSFDPKIENVSSLLQSIARTQPFQKAVIYPETWDADGRTAYSHLTFRQLDQESDCLAAGLKKAGVNPGAKVLLTTGPGLVDFSLFYALLKTGAVPMLTDPGPGLKNTLRCIKTARPEVFIGPHHIRLLKYIFPSPLKSVTTWISTEDSYFIRGLHLSDIRNVPWPRQEPAKVNKADTALMVCSTDTRGNARCIPFTHDSLISLIHDTVSGFAVRKNDVLLSLIPFFSILGPCLGMTTVIPETIGPEERETPFRDYAELIIDQGVTHLVAQPEEFNKTARYIKEYRIQVPSLRRAISLGAPLPPDQIVTVDSYFPETTEVLSLYSTDNLSPVTCIRSRDVKTKTLERSEKGFGNCIGRPLKHVKVNLINITDEQIPHWSKDLAVPGGETGEIVIKQETASNRVSTLPGHDLLNTIQDTHGFWFRTGELGWMDKEGRIWYCGKKSHRIITQTATLYTIPCELILNTHESVAQTAVVGVGPEGSRKPVICVVLKDDNILDRETIRTELLALAGRHVITQQLDTILFPEPDQMVNGCSPEPRREELAEWAEKVIDINPAAGH